MNKFGGSELYKLAVSDALSRCVGGAVFGGGDIISSVLDTDSRRWIEVTFKDGEDLMMEIGGVFDLVNEPALGAAIRAEFDHGPADLTALVLTPDAKVLSRSTDPADDPTPGTYYASVDEYRIPSNILGSSIQILGRDELVEVGRLPPPFTDIVVPIAAPCKDDQKQQRFVFKYYQHRIDAQKIWHAIQICSRTIPHPHINPISHLVVDETDPSPSPAVVGYTQPFIPGGDLVNTVMTGSRPLKLKWVKQLFNVVDDLHLKYGVTHNDIDPRNMLIDPATDNLVLIDFELATKIGIPDWIDEEMQDETPDDRTGPVYLTTVWKDIYFAMRSVYRLTTRDLYARSDAIKRDKWVKAPQVKLDSPIDKYHEVVMDWLHRRNTIDLKITKYSQASEPLDYPHRMPLPAGATTHRRSGKPDTTTTPKLRPVYQHARPLLENLYHSSGGSHIRFRNQVIPPIDATSGIDFLRYRAVQAGRSVLSWDRPSAAHLDPTRRLLANGRYAEENGTETKVKTKAGTGTKSASKSRGKVTLTLDDEKPKLKKRRRRRALFYPKRKKRAAAPTASLGE